MLVIRVAVRVKVRVRVGLSENRRTTGQRRDRTEHPSRNWRRYRRSDDETGPTTGRRDSLTADDGTSNMFSHTN